MILKHKFNDSKSRLPLIFKETFHKVNTPTKKTQLISNVNLFLSKDKNNLEHCFTKHFVFNHKNYGLPIHLDFKIQNICKTPTALINTFRKESNAIHPTNSITRKHVILTKRRRFMYPCSPSNCSYSWNNSNNNSSNRSYAHDDGYISLLSPRKPLLRSRSIPEELPEITNSVVIPSNFSNALLKAKLVLSE
jgi:hypothetical protein